MTKCECGGWKFYDLYPHYLKGKLETQNSSDIVCLDFSSDLSNKRKEKWVCEKCGKITYEESNMKVDIIKDAKSYNL